MKYFALLALFLGPALLAQDDVKHDIAKIAAISDNAERLAAFDALAAKLKSTATTQPNVRPPLAAPPTILTNRPASTSNLGLGASDIFKSEYGEYLAELEEIVQAQWYRLLEESRVLPPHGSHAVVTFQINSRGEIDILKVEDYKAGKAGTIACTNALQAKQPYRKWTKEMIAKLGKEQTLTFAFYYQ